MGCVRPPDAKGGATLEVNDILSSARTCPGAAPVGSQETVECALALLSDFLSCRHFHPPALLRALLFGFSEVRDCLQGCIHLPGGWAGGCAWTVLKISGGKQVRSCYLELARVSACRGRQSLRLPAPPGSSQPNLKQDIPPWARPSSQPHFSEKLSFGIKITWADKVSRTFGPA